MAASEYWVWRDAELAHPEGRAAGGEPCVQCGQPVPPNAHWKHRDRHICSPGCNKNLCRKFGRRLKKGELVAPVAVDPYGDREPMLFGMDESLLFPFEFLGWSPRCGDLVYRYGATTAYERLTLPASDIESLRTAMTTMDDMNRQMWSSILEFGAVATHLETGSTLLTQWTPSGSLANIHYWTIEPDGNRSQLQQPFEADGRTWVWTLESFLHVEDDDPYTWTAPVCVPYPVPPGLHASPWTPDYVSHSERLHRITSSTARHSRRVRMRGPDGVIERIDPHEICCRDEWRCGLCRELIDPSVRWPDPKSASLDHIIPLAANGTHTAANVQAAHLLCNIRKGARSEG